MEVVEAGYKMTEVGLIPEDWEVVSFAELADPRVKWSITGGPFGSNLKTSDYTSEGVQIIQLQNIGDGEFINDSKVYTSEKKANELISNNIYPNEIIMSKMGDPVARACIIPNHAKRFLMASDGIRLVPDDRYFDFYFIHEFINSPHFRNRAIDASTGSTRQRIGLGDLKKLLIIKPTLTEQKAIATALSDVDALISQLDQLIEKKKAIKQGAMQELLTMKPDSNVVKLGKHSKMSSGGTPSSKIDEYYDGDIIWISISDITNSGKYIDTSSKRISEKGLESSSARMFPAGTVFLAMYASIGKCAIITKEASTSQAILGISPKTSLSNEYLYYFLLYNKEKIANQGQQGTQSNLNKGMVQEIDVVLPNIKKQEEIVEILSDIDSEVEKLGTKREKYKQIKQGMMQELLTGKTRLI